MTRRRYRVNDATGEVYEVPLDAPTTPRVELRMGEVFEGARAIDGTDISSRRKYLDYMKRNNLVPTADFQQTWAEAPKKREAEQRAARREAVGRAAYQVLEKGRKRA